jgi:hypothetical protein
MLLILFVLNPVLNGENALLFEIFKLFVVIGEIPVLNVKAGIVLLLVLFELNPLLNVVNVLLLFVIGGMPELNVNTGIVLLLVIFVLFIIGGVPVSFNKLLIDVIGIDITVLVLFLSFLTSFNLSNTIGVSKFSKTLYINLMISGWQ